MKKEAVFLEIPELANLRKEVARLTERLDSLVQEMKSDRAKDNISQRYLSLQEMTVYTGLSKHTIIRYFPISKAGSKKLFDKIEVDALLRNKAVEVEKDDYVRFKNRLDSLISKSRR